MDGPRKDIKLIPCGRRIILKVLIEKLNNDLFC